MAGIITMIKGVIVTVWLMMMSLTVSAAGNTLFNTGEIVTINGTTMSFDDQFFKLSPTVKVWSANKKKLPLSRLKVGDYVALTLITIGKKSLVDHIYLSPFNK